MAYYLLCIIFVLVDSVDLVRDDESTETISNRVLAIHRVDRSDLKLNLSILGKIGDKSCKMMVDSGSEVTLANF